MRAWAALLFRGQVAEADQEIVRGLDRLAVVGAAVPAVVEEAVALAIEEDEMAAGSDA